MEMTVIYTSIHVTLTKGTKLNLGLKMQFSFVTVYYFGCITHSAAVII